MSITSFDQLDLTKQYTYSDYLTWKFQERVELIRGWVVKMSPAPNRKHQEISFFLGNEIYSFLKGKNCKAYSAPFDVVLSKKDASTVVQPDLCVICDLSKLTEQGCTGAPDLIIEILSPGNSRKEMKDKFELYEENGVKEYWLVIPEKESVTVYSQNEKGKYIGSKPFIANEKIITNILPYISLITSEIFRD